MQGSPPSWGCCSQWPGQRSLLAEPDYGGITCVEGWGHGFAVEKESITVEIWVTRCLFCHSCELGAHPTTRNPVAFHRVMVSVPLTPLLSVSSKCFKNTTYCWEFIQ